MPYEIWSTDDGVAYCEGMFQSLIAALPVACRLGETCIIIDASLSAPSDTRLDPARIVAVIASDGTGRLVTPDASRCPEDFEPKTTIFQAA